MLLKTAVLQPFNQYDGANRFGGSAVTQLYAFPTWQEGLLFLGLVDPMTWPTPNLWCALNLTIYI